MSSNNSLYSFKKQPMTNLPEEADWESSIYQLEPTDPVLGGESGIANRQATQLGNRTAYHQQIRYGGVLICPHCGSTARVYRYKKQPKVCHYRNCNNNFSVFKDTIKGKDKRLSGPQLKAVSDDVCEKGCTVISDGLKGTVFLIEKEKFAFRSGFPMMMSLPFPTFITPSAIKKGCLLQTRGRASTRTESKAIGRCLSAGSVGRTIQCLTSICRGILTSFASVRISASSRPSRGVRLAVEAERVETLLNAIFFRV